MKNDELKKECDWGQVAVLAVELVEKIALECWSAEVRTRKYNTGMVDNNGLLFQKNSTSCALEYSKVSQCAPKRDTGRHTVLSNSRRRTRSSRRSKSENSISRVGSGRSGSGVERKWSGAGGLAPTSFVTLRRSIRNTRD